MTSQRICIWSGIVAMITFLVGLVITGWVPPPPPTNSAAQVAAEFRENTTRIQIGLSVIALAGALVGPWVSAVSTMLKRMEGPDSSLARAQLALGCLLPLEFIVPVFVWQVAAFRADEWPDQTIQMLNDMAWLPFTGVVYTPILQFIVIAIAIFRDNGPDAIFPRWAGYLCLLFASCTCPGGLVVFFKTGPFAWNGILSFWVVGASFVTLSIVISVLMFKAARKIEQD